MSTSTQLDHVPPVYCLAFSDSERRSRMEARFAAVQVPCYFVEPISEAQIKIDIADLARQRGLAVPKDFHFWAAAIMQGHLKMIRAFVEETSASHGVFCEDDLHLRLSLGVDLRAMTESFDRRSLDILLLGYLSADKDETTKELFVFSDYDDGLWGAQMYMLSRSRAHAILERYDLSYALTRRADDIPFASDWTITKQGRRARVTPMLAVEEGGTITSDAGQSAFHRRCFEAQYDARYYTPLSIGKTASHPSRFVHDPGHGDTKLNGFPAIILGSRYADAGHLVPGYYERELVDWCRDIIPKARLGQFVDCGAHMGSWTLVMARAFGEVHAFEPQRLIYQRLCGNVALNGLDNVFAYNVGLDETEGQLTLQRPRDDDPRIPWDRDRGRSTASEPVMQHLTKEGVVFSPELVKVTTLDTFADVLTDVGLVKIDVEGLELRVLKGAAELLRKNDLPNVMIECWDWEWYRPEKEKLVRFLEDLGYRVVPIRGYSSQLLAEKK